MQGRHNTSPEHKKITFINDKSSGKPLSCQISSLNSLIIKWRRVYLTPEIQDVTYYFENQTFKGKPLFMWVENIIPWVFHFNCKAAQDGVDCPTDDLTWLHGRRDKAYLVMNLSSYSDLVHGDDDWILPFLLHHTGKRGYSQIPVLWFIEDCCIFLYSWIFP